MITDGETFVYNHVRSSRSNPQTVRRQRPDRGGAEPPASRRNPSGDERLQELEVRVAALEKRLSQLTEQRRQAAEPHWGGADAEQAPAPAGRTSPGSGIKVSLYPSGGTTAIAGEARIKSLD